MPITGNVRRVFVIIAIVCVGEWLWLFTSVWGRNVSPAPSALDMPARRAAFDDIDHYFAPCNPLAHLETASSDALACRRLGGVSAWFGALKRAGARDDGNSCVDDPAMEEVCIAGFLTKTLSPDPPPRLIRLAPACHPIMVGDPDELAGTITVFCREDYDRQRVDDDRSASPAKTQTHQATPR